MALDTQRVRLYRVVIMDYEEPSIVETVLMCWILG